MLKVNACVFLMEDIYQFIVFNYYEVKRKELLSSLATLVFISKQSKIKKHHNNYY